jgi:hypothetical protein
VVALLPTWIPRFAARDVNGLDPSRLTLACQSFNGAPCTSIFEASGRSLRLWPDRSSPGSSSDPRALRLTSAGSGGPGPRWVRTAPFVLEPLRVMAPA